MGIKILNSKGEPVVLNAMETIIAGNLQKKSNEITNALGFEIDITTLTTIMKKISEQKFFEVAPADFLPVRVGEGAWSQQLLTYRSFSMADDFATGLLNTGGNNGRLAQADTAVDGVPVVIRNWAKSIGWSLMELNIAAKAGNWDLVTSKEKSRKKNWDLGIQKVAFLGLDGDASVKGLYTQADVNTNLELIIQAIKELGGTDLKYFCAHVLDAYRTNCARTAMPTHFIIPESDYLGLAAPSNADFHIKSTLQVLEETFQIMTKNPGFKILPCAYGDKVYSGLSTQMYVLLNYEEESLRMDIPVDYTNTLANSIDNFSFQNVGYGQFTGVKAYRPLEMLYFAF